MKKKVLIAVLLFLICTTKIFSQNTPFESWLTDPMIQTTYVTRVMLRLAPDVAIGSVSLRQLDDKLEQVEIYVNRKGAVTWQGEYTWESALKCIKGRYELALQMTDGDSDTAAYIKISKEKEGTEFGDYSEEAIVDEMIMLNLEKAKPNDSYRKCTTIRLVGKFTMGDIAVMTQKQDEQLRDNRGEVVLAGFLTDSIERLNEEKKELLQKMESSDANTSQTVKKLQDENRRLQARLKAINVDDLKKEINELNRMVQSLRIENQKLK